VRVRTRSGGSREPAREARRGGVGTPAGCAGRGAGAEPPRGIGQALPEREDSLEEAYWET
jgi:hypothetical protein